MFAIPLSSQAVTINTGNINAAWGGITGTLSDQLDLQSALDAKLPSASYTAADVLAKLLTVDGAGTSLDSDLLDGQHGSYYLAWANLTGAPATFPPSSHTHLQSEVTDLTANETIDHSSVSISTQYSLTGGGNLTATRTLNLVNDVASPGNSKLYGTDASGVRGWYNIPTGGGGALDDLTDVIITTPSTGQILKFNGTNWVNDIDLTGGGGGNLDSLTDVIITAAATNDVLQFDGTNWVDLPLTLNQVANPTTNKTFTMVNNTLSFTWVAPTAVGLELEATGAFTGDLLHIHQHTGNPGTTNLVYIESTDSDVTPFKVAVAGVNKLVTAPSGRVLLNNATDNGLDALQVNGTITAGIGNATSPGFNFGDGTGIWKVANILVFTGLPGVGSLLIRPNGQVSIEPALPLTGDGIGLKYQPILTITAPNATVYGDFRNAKLIIADPPAATQNITGYYCSLTLEGTSASANNFDNVHNTYITTTITSNNIIDCALVNAITIFNGTKAGTGVITEWRGLNILTLGTLAGATRNSAIYSAVNASGTLNWFLYSPGTALNYLSGALLIGSATPTTLNPKVQIAGAIEAYNTDILAYFRGTGAAAYTRYIAVTGSADINIFRFGISNAAGTIRLQALTDVLAGGVSVLDFTRTANELTQLRFGTAAGPLFIADEATDIVTVRDSFTVNTNAFLVNSSKNVLIGSATDTGEKLQVTGTMKVTGAVTLSTQLEIASGGTGQTTANAALNALLPTQTGNSGKFLKTNATDSSWQSIVQADISDLTANETVDHSTVSISTQHSLTGGGTIAATRTLNLVGDVASPTASQYYGTNASSVRGWYNLPAGGASTLDAISDPVASKTFSMSTFNLALNWGAAGAPFKLQLSGADKFSLHSSGRIMINNAGDDSVSALRADGRIRGTQLYAGESSINPAIEVSHQITATVGNYTGIKAFVMSNLAGTITEAAVFDVLFRSGAGTTTSAVGYKVTMELVSGTVTASTGLLITDTLLGATRMGMRSQVSSGSNNYWNLYADGTAHNYIAGNLLIGSSTESGTNEKLQVTGNVKISGALTLTTALAIAQGGTGQTSAANAINALLPTQTGNSGKYLTTDGTVASWAAITASATPAGANTEIQFNDSGATGADADFTWNKTANLLTVNGIGNFDLIQLNESATPATPGAGIGDLYVVNKAGKLFPSFVGPSGVDFLLQPAFQNNKIRIYYPTSGTTGTGGLSTTWTSLTTVSHPTPASTDKWTQIVRTRWQSSTTAGTATGVRESVNSIWRGNAAERGGFYFFARFGQQVNLNGGQMFVGLKATAALGGDPSALTNMIGMGYDAGDASTGNWFLMRNDGSGTATKVDLGANAVRNTTHFYDLHIHCAPNDSKITVRVVNEFTGTVVLDNIEYTTDLPTSTTFMAMHAVCRNGAVAAACNIEVASLYCISDY